MQHLIEMCKHHASISLWFLGLPKHWQCSKWKERRHVCLPEAKLILIVVSYRRQKTDFKWQMCPREIPWRIKIALDSRLFYCYLVVTVETQNNILGKITFYFVSTHLQRVPVKRFDSPIPYSPASLIKPSLLLTCSPWCVTMETDNPHNAQFDCLCTNI